MKKKILVTASTLPRWQGDTEPRFVLDLSKELNKYYDVTILAPMGIGAKEVEILEGVNVIRYHYFPIKKWETLCYPGAIVPRVKEKKIRALLIPFLILSLYYQLFKLRKKYDLIHAHWLIPQGLVQSLFSKQYIVTGHGADVTALNSFFLKNMKSYCIKKAKRITVVSEHLKKEVNKIYKRDDIEVLSMGCNKENFGKKYRIDDYFQQKEKKVILFVGRLAEKKGVEYLIKAMEYVPERLVIVGSGPLENQLKKLASSISADIIFLGARSHEELNTIYASADIFVAPSITAQNGDQEGFGLVILEAMASGLPVIASNSGGIKQFVHHGINGLLVEEKDVEGLAKSINKVLHDKNLNMKLIENGYCTTEKYDYKNIGLQYKKIIEELLEDE